MNAPLRFGILGCARIARMQVIPAMQQAKNAVPFAIASRDPQKLAETAREFGIEKGFGDYDSLLRDPDVDAVYIPLPNSLHKEWTVKAARAGKHVLCEKPLALCQEDVAEMEAACQQNGVKLMEAFMYRFTPRIAKLVELLDSGAVGRVRHINSTFRFVMDRQSIKLDPALGGGSLWDIGCYPVNLIGLVMKEEEPVSVAALQTVRGGVDISLSAVLKYPSGALCTVNCGFDSQACQFTEINGTEGTLLMRDSFTQTDTPILLVQNNVAREIPVDACQRYVLEVEAFADAVLEDKPPFLSLDETRRNIRLIKRILDAAV